MTIGSQGAVSASSHHCMHRSTRHVKVSNAISCAVPAGEGRAACLTCSQDGASAWPHHCAHCSTWRLEVIIVASSSPSHGASWRGSRRVPSCSQSVVPALLHHCTHRSTWHVEGSHVASLSSRLGGESLARRVQRALIRMAPPSTLVDAKGRSMPCLRSQHALPCRALEARRVPGMPSWRLTRPGTGL
jgi:hypothetical protein